MPDTGQTPSYQPTSDDYLVRYIKTLVWRTMDRNACHVAVALGCFLYEYQPRDMASLAPGLFNLHNMRRVKRRVAAQLHARFQGSHFVRDGCPILDTRPPTPDRARPPDCPPRAHALHALGRASHFPSGFPPVHARHPLWVDVDRL